MLSWEHLYEFALYVAVRHRLKDSRQLQRFEAVTGHYSKVCTKLLGGAEGSRVVADGYDWTGWAGAIRKEFQDGVPIGFLAYPTVSHTMVFARRRGIKLTSKLIDIVLQVFGKETTVNLIREDYIGLPTISNAGYMTSAVAAITRIIWHIILASAKGTSGIAIRLLNGAGDTETWHES
jgi:hypothetical protein